jgi:ketosteroid isomerase-like protein
MKKLLVNLFFLSFATWGFSQPTFTEKTMQDQMLRFAANPLKFLNEETDPTFTLMGAEGRPFGYDIVKGWFSAPDTKMKEWSIADLKVQQLRKTAIAMGIKTHIISVHDTVISRGVERFTYLFEFKNDKWLWTYGQHTALFKPVAEEEAAVKKLLVDDRKAYYAGDGAAMSKFYKNDPKNFVMLTSSDGYFLDMGNEGIQKAIASFKPDGTHNDKGEITSSKVNVYGNIAVANLELTETAANGTQEKEHNIALLEKEGDAWKLIGWSVHSIPKKKAEEEAAIKSVIEKETQAWLDRDAEARIACLANVPHALLLVYHGNMASNKGVAYVTNEKMNVPEAIKTQTAGMGKPDGTTFKNENYVITIKGGTAFVTYDEISTNAEGKKQHFHEVRNLEKIKGFWKITYVGAVTYTPN